MKYVVPKVMPLRSPNNWLEMLNEVRRLIPAADPQPERVPLCSIRDLLLNQLKAKAVLIGYPFLDEDYTYDYLHHIGRSFYELGRECVRLHFFNDEGVLAVNQNGIGELDVYGAGSGRCEHYLGYMVIRPTGTECVGRTILRDPYERSKLNRVRVKDKQRCDAYGVELSVTGTPFMQQDTSSHVCAGAALWSAAHYLHHRYHTHRLFPRQIDEMARAHYGGKHIGRGLTPTQLTHILRNLGCSMDGLYVTLTGKPTMDSDREFSELLSIVFGYVESTLPVLLAYWGQLDREGHVVMINGYRLDQGRLDAPPTSPVLSSVTDSVAMRLAVDQSWLSNCVNAFFCQDDQKGPYSVFPVHEDDPEQRALDRPGSIAVIPCVTGDAFLSYTEAKKVVHRELAAFLAPDRIPADAGGDLIRRGVLELVKGSWFRLYLQQSRRFRSQLIDTRFGRRHLPTKILEYYRTQPLPRYLYVCDILDRTYEHDPDSGMHRFGLRGEMILDATVPSFAIHRALLALRIENQLFIRDEAGALVLEWDSSSGAHSGLRSLAPVNLPPLE
ncbi:MAG: hypothetical protein FLDDKLPJ_00016 [Phycisphaerae bacterium]|nr:hypothetical protein [Phycisphaerae bacterium]